MIRHRHIDRICAAAILLALILTGLLCFGEVLGLRPASAAPGYASRLFDDDRVHTVDLRVEDWAAFLENAPAEEYIPCTAVIDGEEFYQVGLRAKGNNSLRLTEEYGLSRYSLKLEFDHYVDGGNYHGLDKLSLDASFQDNSYLKTYLAYHMMAYMEAPAPLCSYAWVTVNGAPWGLFLAIEEPEEAFARRNFGPDHGALYKPDYHSLNAENADVALWYTGDDPALYPNIFDNARFSTDGADRERLIQALRVLSTGEDLETAINVDEVLRYFTVQVFVMNWDSYLGHTGHNYFLYEEDGVISILPWDYNLAFGTYALGMTDPIRDPDVLINWPINTPARGETMLKRPLYHNLMKNNDYFARYHAYFDHLLTEYFESGRYEAVIRQTQAMIAPYVQADPTAFCSYEDHLLAVDTLLEVCHLRSESVRGQLEGDYPATLAQWAERPVFGVDASHVDLRALGDFDDLEAARERQDEAAAVVAQTGTVGDVPGRRYGTQCQSGIQGGYLGGNALGGFFVYFWPGKNRPQRSAYPLARLASMKQSLAEVQSPCPLLHKGCFGPGGERNKEEAVSLPPCRLSKKLTSMQEGQMILHRQKALGRVFPSEDGKINQNLFFSGT
ncbi:CotH kinase family protein [Pseudoflavonifractor capillosus]|uniref:CotH kinase family protein n=1 Tax=Pseudoflavonifractor capillosus TaxID=106588 RepID=UPI00195A7387|nr:CotH kinase family protein [Pseudoflavonifractor capillosus]MBM6897131.1 CotH kinase family protein [Pseudoflavonifractor capillosus]